MDCNNERVVFADDSGYIYVEIEHDRRRLPHTILIVAQGKVVD